MFLIVRVDKNFKQFPISLDSSSSCNIYPYMPMGTNSASCGPHGASLKTPGLRAPSGPRWHPEHLPLQRMCWVQQSQPLPPEDRNNGAPGSPRSSDAELQEHCGSSLGAKFHTLSNITWEKLWVSSQTTWKDELTSSLSLRHSAFNKQSLKSSKPQL